MERRTTIINGKTYVMLTPPVRKAMPLCTQVGVLVGPVLGTIRLNTASGGMEKFALAIKGIDPDKLDALFMRAVFIGKLHCDSVPVFEEVDFERHFAEHRQDTYHACVWALWESVKDFFPKLDHFTQKAEGMVKEFQSQMDGETTTG